MSLRGLTAKRHSRTSSAAGASWSSSISCSAPNGRKAASAARLRWTISKAGWRFKWLSSYGVDFNFDYHVSFAREDLARGKVDYNYQLIDASIDELSGISLFYKDE